MNFRVSDTTMSRCLQKYYKVDAAACKQLKQSKGGLPEACRVLFCEKQLRESRANCLSNPTNKPLCVEDLKKYFWSESLL